MKTFRIPILLLAVLVFSCTDAPLTTQPEDGATVASIVVSVNPELLDPTVPGAVSTVTIACYDRDGNPSPAGQRLTLTTTMGRLSEEGFTDHGGRFVTLFDPEGHEGAAYIKAFVASTNRVVEGGAVIDMVNPAIPVSIRITAAPTMINPSGSGGTETSVITAELLNGIGAPVTQQRTVTCEVVNQPDPPIGCIINGVGPIDTVVSEASVARFGLNAGTMVGPVVIHVYTWSDAQRRDVVGTTLSSVAVVSGPPAALSLDIDNLGWDVGGAWEIEVSALVIDRNVNPVADKIPVVFSLQPDDVGIITNGTTGNVSRLGNSAPGVANARLIYNSYNTFEPIAISAQVATEDGLIQAQRQTALPLQKGYMSLSVDPGNWMFDRGRANDTCLVRCWVTLKDGHDVPVNNAPILFSTDLGKYFWRNQVGGRYMQYFPEPARKYTGVVNQNHNEPPGVATVYLRGPIADFFADDFALQTTVHIRAEVEGYGFIGAEPQVVIMNRH